MLTLEALLSNGYFPRELPPPFSTDKYGSVLKNSGAIPSQLLTDCPQSRPAVFNLARAGSLRRKLSILNPISYFKLSTFVVDKWAELERLSNRSPLSLTSPVVAGSGRAIDRKTSPADYPQQRTAVRSASRYVLVADIARYYHSIYTHSIPWAIHGKSIAKTDRSPNLWGNTMDKLVRDTQDGQTMGIPIGPDVSLVIAELLLGAVDTELMQKSNVRGIRYIDDYELSFASRSSAERVRGLLQEVLSQYELGLNDSKTIIHELPLALQETWVSELGYFRLREQEDTQRTDLLRYFDRAFGLAKENPTGAVLRYAVGRIANIRIEVSNHALLRDLLLQCAMVEPGCLPIILRVFCKLKAKEDWVIDAAIAEIAEEELDPFQVAPAAYERVITAEDLGPSFEAIIRTHAIQGHSSEVVWALWGCLLFGVKIRSDAADALREMNDPTVAILALHAQQIELLPTKTYLASLSQFLTVQDLYGEQWLLSYEANVKGWLTAPDGVDNVGTDPRFSILKNSGVSFYDVTKVAESFETAKKAVEKEEEEEEEQVGYF